jgi:hypothetical protein
VEKPLPAQTTWTKPEIAAACGLYCGACPVYIANAGVTNLDEIAAERNLPREEIVCEGCQGGKVTVWCRTCVMRRCPKGQRKAFGATQTCAVCPDFPCADYVEFRDDPAFPYHLDAPLNLEALRVQGRHTWLDRQAAAFACPSCGRRLSWWDKNCPVCARPVSPSP